MGKSVQNSIFLLMLIYFCFKKFFEFFFCSAYLSSCHQIASDAKYWTIRALFIAMTTSCLEESAPAYRSFQWSNIPVNFFEFLSTELAACLKPPAEIIIVKRLIQRHNNVTRVWVEPRSYDQSHRKNEGFISISASLSALLNSSSPHSKLQQKRHSTISL